MFVSALDELEEQIRGVLFDWDVSAFINDDQALAAELDEVSGAACLAGVLIGAGWPSPLPSRTGPCGPRGQL